MITEGSFWVLKDKVKKILSEEKGIGSVSNWIRCQEILVDMGLDPTYARTKALFNLIYTDKIEPVEKENIEDVVANKITYSQYLELIEDEEEEF